MGLFGKFFDKKECSICGGEIGLLGNCKLEDGNMCKDCAGQLSFWFDGRKHSTVEQMKEQLAYREANKKEVENFNTTQTFGERSILCIDEGQKKFLVARTKNMQAENPDVLELSQVTGCDINIDEHRYEEMRENKEGKEVSYNPPRYKYTYDFYAVIRVRHPYFTMMRFQLNASSVEIYSEGSTTKGALGLLSNSFTASQNYEYQQYEQMGKELKEALLNARQQVREEEAAANAPKVAVTCPWCGATTTPDASGCCEFCGGSLNG